jgi:hypothetical protein
MKKDIMEILKSIDKKDLSKEELVEMVTQKVLEKYEVKEEIKVEKDNSADFGEFFKPYTLGPSLQQGPTGNYLTGTKQAEIDYVEEAKNKKNIQLTENDFKIEKAEGSRGGVVVGHDKKGNPIYGHEKTPKQMAMERFKKLPAEDKKKVVEKLKHQKADAEKSKNYKTAKACDKALKACQGYMSDIK